MEKWSEWLTDDLDGAVISSRYNKGYLTGLFSSRGMVLLSEDEIALVIDSRYAEEQAKKYPYDQIFVAENWSATLQSIQGWAKDKGIKRLGFEGSLLDHKRGKELTEGIQAEWVSKDFSQYRAQKDESEIEKMRTAASIADRAFIRLLKEVELGMTELEIERRLLRLIRQEGGRKESFPPVVVSGERGAYPHGSASDRVVQAGDFVTLDFGAVYQGYCSDLTRTFCMQGEANDELVKIYEIVKRAQLAGIQAAKAGARISEVDLAARSVIEAAGYGDYFVHNTGHGVGLEVHEYPSVSPLNEEILLENMVITVEPGIYLPGIGGVRLEENICIRQDGAELLSSGQAELQYVGGKQKNSFDLAPDRLVEKCRKWDAGKIEGEFGCAPKDPIPMWIADMDFRAPQSVLDSFQEALEVGVFGYTSVYEEFDRAVQNWFEKRRGLQVEKEWITLCYGTVSTLHYLVQAFCVPGDKVLMNTPIYSPFQRCVEAYGAQVLCSPLELVNNRYEMNFEQMESLFRAHQPKIYFLCSPHNPSGRIWSQDEIEKLVSLCQEYGVLLVSDEVHGDHINQGKHASIVNWMDEDRRIILLSSPNKAFNLGGLKTSYAIIRNQEVRECFQQKLKSNSITSPNVFGIRGIIAAYEHGEAWLDEMVAYVGQNYAYVMNFLSEELPELRVMEMEASYLLWINIEKTGLSSTDFVLRLAREQGVLLEDGHHFVQDGDSYVRMNLGTQLSLVKEACQRIQIFIKALK